MSNRVRLILYCLVLLIGFVIMPDGPWYREFGTYVMFTLAGEIRADLWSKAIWSDKYPHSRF